MADSAGDPSAEPTSSGLSRRIAWMGSLTLALVIMEWLRFSQYTAFRGWPGLLRPVVLLYYLFILIGGPVWVFLAVVGLGIAGLYRPWGLATRLVITALMLIGGAAVFMVSKP